VQDETRIWGSSTASDSRARRYGFSRLEESVIRNEHICYFLSDKELTPATEVSPHFAFAQMNFAAAKRPSRTCDWVFN
jgi:hypothetical protein